MEYEEVIKMYYESLETIKQFSKNVDIELELIDSKIEQLEDRKSRLRLEKYLSKEIITDLGNKEFQKMLKNMERLYFILESEEI